jgi:hypothetical protein
MTSLLVFSIASLFATAAQAQSDQDAANSGNPNGYVLASKPRTVKTAAIKPYDLTFTCDLKFAKTGAECATLGKKSLLAMGCTASEMIEGVNCDTEFSKVLVHYGDERETPEYSRWKCSIKSPNCTNRLPCTGLFKLTTIKPGQGGAADFGSNYCKLGAAIKTNRAVGDNTLIHTGRQ